MHGLQRAQEAEGPAGWEWIPVEKSDPGFGGSIWSYQGWHLSFSPYCIVQNSLVLTQVLNCANKSRKHWVQVQCCKLPCKGEKPNRASVPLLFGLPTDSVCFLPCSSPISIPYPAGVSMATPRKAVLPSDMGEMVNG